MKLYHATTRTRLASIQEQGLLFSYADPSARIKGVWLHTRSLSPWAVLHTQRRHGASLEDVIIIEVTLRREKLVRFRKGLWYIREDVPTSSLGLVIEGAFFGKSASH